MSEVTEIIKRLRSMGYSQSEIERRTGIKQSKLSRWEAGRVARAGEEVLRLVEFERACTATARTGAAIEVVA